MPKYRDENGRYIPTTGLSKQQIQAIYLIVYEGKKGKEVYEAVGAPCSTYYDWYKQDLFMEELEKERKVLRRQFKNKAWKRLGDVLENASYLGEIKGDVKTLVDKPAKRWDSVVEKALTVIVGLLVGFLLSGGTM